MFYFTAYMPIGTALYSITAVNLTSTLIFVDGAGQVGYLSLTVTPTDLIIAGNAGAQVYGPYQGSNDLLGARMSLQNNTVTYGWQFGSSGNEYLLNCNYNAATDTVYVSGFAAGTIVGLTAQTTTGTGLCLAIKWSLAKNNVTMPVAFGPTGNTCQAQGIDYNDVAGAIVVSAEVYTSGSGTLYGDYDAMLWTFYNNGSTITSKSYGGSSSDSGSTVLLPYVLLSARGYMNSAFGT